jgi:hypothetical protein
MHGLAGWIVAFCTFAVPLLIVAETLFGMSRKGNPSSDRGAVRSYIPHLVAMPIGASLGAILLMGYGWALFETVLVGAIVVAIGATRTR